MNSASPKCTWTSPTSGVIKVQYYISDMNLGGTLAIEVATYNGNVVVIMVLL